jgi:uncharacterized protein DUF2760
MRVALILGVLLILTANGAAVAPATEPFRPYLRDATLALSVLVLIGLLLPARQKPPPSKPQAEPARAAPPALAAARADAEIVSFLAMLQEKGRLVDFLMDNINPYNDAQVGAAARVVHAGCKRVLQEHFSIHPLRTEDEGSTVQVPAGYAADRGDRGRRDVRTASQPSWACQRRQL